MIDPKAEQRIFVLDVRFAQGGAWAGVETLFDTAYQEVTAAGRQDLIDCHSYELHMVLKQRRDVIPLHYASLTDLASGVEKTRNFPLDRAYRIVHGLVDLMLSWRMLDLGALHWTIVARRADAAQHLASRFLNELARRGATAGIRVVAETPRGFAWLDEGGAATGVWLEAAISTPLVEHDPIAGATLLAKHPDLLASMALVEEHHPILIAYYEACGDSLAGARVALQTLCLFNHFGFYYESGSFADTVTPHFDALVGADEDARWNYLGNIFQGLVMIGRQADARQLIETHAVPVLTRPDLRARMHYLLAMVHLRYADQVDLDLAEIHILAAREAITVASATFDAADYVFLSVFIDNGLAFLRVRQKRTREAVTLCQAGYELITSALGGDAHRLHRSVLQYNTAQVYAAIGDSTSALYHYDYAIAMDPNYSEYYNESANLLLKQDRHEEALVRYRSAAAVSPPYPELFHNIGVCHARLDDWPAARVAFDRCLDLNPQQPSVLLMRAEVLDALGDEEAALTDLDQALFLEPTIIAARVNRAVTRFRRGEFILALSDMDEVIASDPVQPDHFENRAEVYRALGYATLLAADLQRAEVLRLAA